MNRNTHKHTHTYIKKKQVEISRTKNTATKTKLTFDRLNSRIQMTEKTISTLKVKVQNYPN